MIVTTSYKVEYDDVQNTYRIKSKMTPYCPDCGQLLSGYDTRARKAIDCAAAAVGTYTGTINFLIYTSFYS